MTTRAAWLSPWVRVSLAFCTTSKRYVFLSVLFAKNFSPKNQITLAAFCAVGSSLARPSAAEKLGVGNFLLPLGYLSTRLRGSTLCCEDVVGSDEVLFGTFTDCTCLQVAQTSCSLLFLALLKDPGHPPKWWGIYNFPEFQFQIAIR